MASKAVPADHAEKMDAVYGVQRHFYDLTRKYYLLGRDRLVRELAVPPGGSVLEVGCGTGRNLALVGRRYRTARLFGFDISAQMLKSARINLTLTRVMARTHLAQGDATAFDPVALFGQAQFDRVFMSYTVSMIPDWRAAISAASAVLAPGGELHIVDFGQQRALPRWFARMLGRWLTKFHVTPRAELFDYCADLAARQGMTITRTALLRDYAWSVVIRK